MFGAAYVQGLKTIKINKKMTHLQKYWWIYLLLAIAIYFYFFFGFIGPSKYEEWKNRNKQPIKVLSQADGSPCDYASDPAYIPGVWKNGICGPVGAIPINETGNLPA